MDNEQVVWVNPSRETCALGCWGTRWEKEAQTKMLVPGNLGQTLDPGVDRVET